MRCERVKNILEIEKTIILRHIDRHKWFQQIEDKETAIADFIQKYGWIIREIYCGYSCPYREECKVNPFLHEDNSDNI